MSDTWKGVPPPSQHPPGRPFSDEQEARIRTMIREEQSRAAMVEADARERRLHELVRDLENGTLRLRRDGTADVADGADGGLRARYRELMRVLPGETPSDAASRRALPKLFSYPDRLKFLRSRVVEANGHLESLDIDLEERIALMRTALPEWATFLAAEVAHGRPAEEGHFWFRAGVHKAGDADAV